MHYSWNTYVPQAQWPKRLTKFNGIVHMYA